jgi:[FeFe] hydrogenase H-cluster maturation GTPase HydF
MLSQETLPAAAQRRIPMPASLNETPSGERVHIGLFGCRNAGKSSLINALTGQDLAIVSDFKGTTTDPVSKAMEILPLGPVLLTDTPGMDDDSDLGQSRIEKARLVLRSTDVALLVVDAAQGLNPFDQKLLTEIQARKIPYIVVFNKIDLAPSFALPQDLQTVALAVSAQEKLHITELKERLAALAGKTEHKRPLILDLLQPGDLTVLVVPVDGSAPKGRLILPQQQTIRELLDGHCTALVTQPEELPSLLKALGSTVKLVVTDSQVFHIVNKMVPPEIPLTSFSILFARYKGQLGPFIEGAVELGKLKDGDKVLISEGCTHHRQCNDIGAVKMPNWIRKFSGAQPEFIFSSGKSFPDLLQEVQLVVHCGGCMLNPQEVAYRQQTAREQHVPMTNYGIAIAYMNGILPRVLAPFPQYLEKIQ